VRIPHLGSAKLKRRALGGPRQRTNTALKALAAKSAASIVLDHIRLVVVHGARAEQSGDEGSRLGADREERERAGTRIRGSG